MPQVGSQAGPGPQCGGLIWEGPYKGCCPRGWTGLCRAAAGTPAISEEPLRGTGGWENKLLVVTDDDEVAVMGQMRAPF